MAASEAWRASPPERSAALWTLQARAKRGPAARSPGEGNNAVVSGPSRRHHQSRRRAPSALGARPLAGRSTGRGREGGRRRARGDLSQRQAPRAPDRRGVSSLLQSAGGFQDNPRAAARRPTAIRSRHGDRRVARPAPRRPHAGYSGDSSDVWSRARRSCRCTGWSRWRALRRERWTEVWRLASDTSDVGGSSAPA